MNQNLISFFKQHYIIQGIIFIIPVFFYFIIPDINIVELLERFNSLSSEKGSLQAFLQLMTEKHNNIIYFISFLKVIFSLLLYGIMFSLSYFIYSQKDSKLNIERILQELKDLKYNYQHSCTEIFFRQLNYESKIEIAKNITLSDSSIKFISNHELILAKEELEKNYIKELKRGEVSSRSYIVHKRVYTKTYLKNDLYIVDLNQTIKVLDDKDCIFKYYYGFDSPESKYAEESYRKDLIKELQESYEFLSKKTSNTNLSEINRFQKPMFIIKKTENSSLTLENISDLKIELKENDKSKGIEITVNIGSFALGKILDIQTSITLPTSLSFSKKPDTISFSNTAAETEITIQEEVYGSSNHSKSIKVKHNNVMLSDNELEHNMNLYYKKTHCKLLYTPKNEKDIYKITVNQI